MLRQERDCRLPAAGAPLDTPGIAAHDCWKPQHCGALGVTTRRPVTMLTRDSSKGQMARHIRNRYLTSSVHMHADSGTAGALTVATACYVQKPFPISDLVKAMVLTYRAACLFARNADPRDWFWEVRQHGAVYTCRSRS